MPIISETSPQNQHKKLREVALAAHDAGLCVFPSREDGTKAPMGSWLQFQHSRPSRQQLQAWYGPHTGIGLVCGRVSGNLECLEFDDADVYVAYTALAWVSAGSHSGIGHWVTGGV